MVKSTAEAKAIETVDKTRARGVRWSDTCAGHEKGPATVTRALALEWVSQGPFGPPAQADSSLWYDNLQKMPEGPMSYHI